MGGSGVFNYITNSICAHRLNNTWDEGFVTGADPDGRELAHYFRSANVSTFMLLIISFSDFNQTGKTKYTSVLRRLLKR